MTSKQDLEPGLFNLGNETNEDMYIYKIAAKGNQHKLFAISGLDTTRSSRVWFAAKPRCKK